MDSKDDPVSGQTRDALSELKDLDHPQKSLLRVIATKVPQIFLPFLAFSNLRDEISFKGGSL
jgi:hypothetical protein